MFEFLVILAPELVIHLLRPLFAVSVSVAYEHLHSFFIFISASGTFEGKRNIWTRKRHLPSFFPWVECGKLPSSAFLWFWGEDENWNDSLLALAMLTTVSGWDLSQKHNSGIRSKWEEYCSLQDSQPFLNLTDIANRYDWIHYESTLRNRKDFFVSFYVSVLQKMWLIFRIAVSRNAYSGKTQRNT